MAFATRALLLDKALGFPSTLLMMGLTNMVAYVLLQITVIFSRCCCVRLGSDPDFKAASIFGTMRCVQGALSTSAMWSSESYHNAILMSFVLTLFIVELMNRPARPHPVTVLSVVLATVGGVLAVTARGTYSFEAFKSMAGFQIVSVIGGSFRLVITQNFMVLEDSSRRLPKVSPLVLASRMSPAVGIASFELACLTGPGCFDTMLHLPSKNYIFQLLFVIGLANAVVLVAELQLLQRTSATFLGFLLVGNGIGVALLPELHQRVHVPALMGIGALIYVVAAGFYMCVESCGRDAEKSMKRMGNEIVDASEYQSLEGGEREKRQKRRSKEERRNGEPRSPRSPRSPRRGGAGVGLLDRDSV